MPVQDFDPKNDGYGGKYVRGADFEDGPEYLTITDVNLAYFADETRKLALTFNDGREATVNKRNFSRLVDKWGGDPNAWIGKTVLCLAGDKFNGNTSLVMHPQPTQKTPKPAPTKTAPQPTGTEVGDVVFG
jgi:hypothetical protein